MPGINIDAVDDGSPAGSYARVRKDSSYWYEKLTCNEKPAGLFGLAGYLVLLC